MGQKLEDIKVLLKNDRRIWAAAGFVFVALFVWLLTGAEGRRPPQGRARIAPGGEASKPGTGAEEAEAARTKLAQALKGIPRHPPT